MHHAKKWDRKGLVFGGIVWFALVFTSSRGLCGFGAPHLHQPLREKPYCTPIAPKLPPQIPWLTVLWGVPLLTPMFGWCFPSTSPAILANRHQPRSTFLTLTTIHILQVMGPPSVDSDHMPSHRASQVMPGLTKQPWPQMQPASKRSSTSSMGASGSSINSRSAYATMSSQQQQQRQAVPPVDMSGAPRGSSPVWDEAYVCAMTPRPV